MLKKHFGQALFLPHPAKRNKFFLLLKIAIVLLSFSYIGYKIAHSGNFSAAFVKDNFSLRPVFLVLALALLPLNISLEALKWRYLVKKTETISLAKALLAVLSGLTMAIFTPNRIGELGSRVFVLLPQNRTKGVFVSFLGGLATMTATVSLGIAALFVFLFYLLPENQSLFQQKQIALTAAGGLLALLVLVFYFNIQRLVKRFGEKKWLERFKTHFDFLCRYSKKELLVSLVLTFLRYGVYSSQFYLLFLFFGLEIEWSEAYISIALAYFVLAFLPNMVLVELGIRGSVTLFFVSMFATGSLEIVSAAVLLWVLNIALPAIAGAPLLWRLRF